MNKLKTFLVGVVSSLSVAVASVPDNAVDFTVTDITGKSHTLFTYLNAGKYVLVDFMTLTSN